LISSRNPLVHLCDASLDNYFLVVIFLNTYRRWSIICYSDSISEGELKVPDTILGSSATTAVSPLGQTVYGSIETNGDHDWFRVNLVAGTTYQFRLHGYGLNDIEDTTLGLIGPNGSTQVAFNDDSGSALWGPAGNTTNGNDSVITYTATATGTYYLNVGGYLDSTVGDYMLTSVVQNPAGMVFTDDEIAWQLINNFNDQSYQGVAWTVGADHSLTVNITGLTAEGGLM
jgi:serralysin